MPQRSLSYLLERRELVKPAALFVAALVLGGGGPHAPLLTAILEALALLLLVHFAVADAPGLSCDRSVLLPCGLLLAYLVLGTAQLVQLPSDWWQQLPGRPLFAATMRTLGRAGEPWPASLSPPDTRDVLLGALPPCAMFFLTLPLDARGRSFLAAILCLVALGSAALGVVQVLAGDGSFFPYGLPPWTRAPGLFANFNHQATFLACALVMATALGCEKLLRGGRDGRWTVLLVTALAIGTLITSSRAGLALLALAGAAGLWLRTGAAACVRARATAVSRRRGRLFAAAAAVAVLALVLLLAGSYRFDLMAERYGDAAEDGRFLFWRNTATAIARFMPVGSGLGTFQAVYQPIEPLSQIDTSYVNHAHNDYLELALELGAAGVMLMGAALAWVAFRLAVVARRPLTDRGVLLARAGGVAAVLIMLHSIVDYPLRTEAIGCVFAFCCALLVDQRRAHGATERRRHRGSRPRASGMVVRPAR